MGNEKDRQGMKKSARCRCGNLKEKLHNSKEKILNVYMFISLLLISCISIFSLVRDSICIFWDDELNQECNVDMDNILGTRLLILFQKVLFVFLAINSILVILFVDARVKENLKSSRYYKIQLVKYLALLFPSIIITLLQYFDKVFSITDLLIFLPAYLLEWVKLVYLMSTDLCESQSYNRINSTNYLLSDLNEQVPLCNRQYSLWVYYVLLQGVFFNGLLGLADYISAFVTILIYEPNSDLMSVVVVLYTFAVVYRTQYFKLYYKKLLRPWSKFHSV